MAFCQTIHLHLLVSTWNTASQQKHRVYLFHSKCFNGFNTAHVDFTSVPLHQGLANSLNITIELRSVFLFIQGLPGPSGPAGEVGKPGERVSEMSGNTSTPTHEFPSAQCPGTAQSQYRKGNFLFLVLMIVFYLR